MVKKNKGKSNNESASSEDPSQLNLSSHSEFPELGTDPKADIKDLEETAETTTTSEILRPPEDSMPEESADSAKKPVEYSSYFEEPEGYGTVQPCENNPPMEEVESPGSLGEMLNNILHPSSPIKASIKERNDPVKNKTTTTKKPTGGKSWWKKNESPSQEPTIKILQRPKATWEDVDIPSFLYDQEHKQKFVSFYENGESIEREGDFGKLIFQSSNLRDVVFCTMKDASSSSPRGVFSVFQCGSLTEQEIRSMIKELQENCQHKMATDEDQVNSASLPCLKNFEVKPLEKKVPNFPGAIYYCELCDFHLNNIGHFREHMRIGQHLQLIEIREQRKKFIRSMPPMHYNQRIAITKILEEVCSRETLPLKKIAGEVQKLIRTRLVSIKGLEGREPDLQLMGSVFYDAFNASSNINFCLYYENVDASDLLDLIYSIRDDFSNDANPFADFSNIEFVNGPYPRISMLYLGKIPVVLLWKATDKLALSKILKRYTDLHPSIPKLLVLIRHWAKLCDLCSSYGLQKHGFDLMAIHCLQSRGIVPVIKDEDSSPCAPAAVDLAVEFLSFFAYYSKKLDTVVQIEQSEPMLKKDTKWNNKIFQIKDPLRGENVVFFPRTFQPYFLNCFLATYVYLAIPCSNNGPLIHVNLSMPDSNKKKDEPRQQRAVSSSTPAGTPMKVDDHPQKPVSVQATIDPRVEALELRLQEQGKINGEDPVTFINSLIDKSLAESKKKNYNRRRSRKRKTTVQSDTEQEEKGNADFSTTQVNGVNLAQLEAHDVEIDGDRIYSRQSVSDVFEAMVTLEEGRLQIENTVLESLLENKILKTLTFNAGKKHCSEALPTNVEEVDESFQALQEETEEKLTNLSLHDDEPDTTTIQEAVLSEISQSDVTGETKTDLSSEEEEQLVHSEQSEGSVFDKKESVLPSQEQTKKAIARDDFKIRCDEEPLEHVFKKATSWSPEEYSYDLDNPVNFNGGWLPDVRCSYCESNKHLNADCPEMRIPELVEITYKRSVEEDEQLTQMIREACIMKSMKCSVVDNIEKTVKQLEATLRTAFPSARLDVFGSLYNGFGTSSSDADICFRFESDSPPEGVNVEDTMMKISRTLKKTYGYKMYVQHILQAKVPIVKFKIHGNGRDPVLEGDISYYNTLALANTKMLLEYTKWDSRVAELGLWVKTWANTLDINDASRGSLSSYSYIIMVIYYLQQLNPPVLPRLQEEFRNEAPAELHGEHDIYYHKDGWPGIWSKNKMTLSELFVGFLDFYSRFDYHNLIIQIRRAKMLSKLEKGWNRSLCIEDPFDLRHNTGSVVNQRMFVHIMRTFRRSREIFMQQIIFNNHNMTYIEISKALLRSCSIGQPPFAPKQCFECYRMGHTKENCPRRKEAEKLNADVRERDGARRRTGRGGGQPWQNRAGGPRGNGPRRDG